MIEVEAIDLFVESDPSNGEDEENASLISLRVPADRELARQLKELGAKWDDGAKEWRIYGSEAVVKQIGNLCKTAFPDLPRRRNRLVATQVAASEGQIWPGGTKAKPADQSQPGGEASSKEAAAAQPDQLELVVRVEFVVNRTIKTYRRGQNLKWLKEYKQVVELPTSLEQTEASSADSRAGLQAKFLAQLQPRIRELERTATEAFEALLSSRKEAVAAILKEADIAQL